MKNTHEDKQSPSPESIGFVRVYPIDGTDVPEDVVDFPEDVVDFPEDVAEDDEEYVMDDEDISNLLSQYNIGSQEENEEEDLMSDVILRYVSGRSRLKIHSLKRPIIK
jgi:hypothetical protein